MPQTQDESRVAGSGVASFVKAIAVLSIVALALVGALFVFDVISRDLLGELFMKVLALAGIVVVAAVAITVVLRSGK